MLTISYSTLQTALTVDIKLHDPTGYGVRTGFVMQSAKHYVSNMYDIAEDHQPIPSEEVNTYLENYRRIAKFRWTPAQDSVAHSIRGAASWPEHHAQNKAYSVRKLTTKYRDDERSKARATYVHYGWVLFLTYLSLNSMSIEPTNTTYSLFHIASVLSKKSFAKSLTQALWRHIIGVASE